MTVIEHPTAAPPAADTDEQPNETPPADPEGKALFDPAQYETEELALPKIDGEGIDKIRAQFTGTVWLERGDPRDVALIRDVKMGATVTLMVEATVGPPVPGMATNKDGDLDVLTLGRTFKITSVYRPAAEEL